MSEANWLACDSPERMLTSLRDKASDRKFRLFAVACCRKIWPIYRGKLSCRGVVLAERLADNLPINEDLPAFRSSLHYEGFREIDGYRQEKANQVQYHLANAAYHALADAGPSPTTRSFTELLDQFRGGPLFSAVGEILGGAMRDFLSIESWIRPDLTQTWREAAWAIAHSKRRNDHVAVRPEDVAQESREQVPLLCDIFGNPFRPVAVDAAWLTRDVLLLAQGIYAEKAFDRMPILADALQDASCADGDILDHCRSANQIHVRGCWVVDLLLGKA